ncbi:MAG: CRISPR system precrRNA processing endoribonuclease RAMP protein Cas6 [Pseudonocardiaceae bacterium]
MPAAIEIDLLPEAGLVIYPARLHGAACALLEDGSAGHRAGHKPFSAGPVTGCGPVASWRLGWLRDGACVEPAWVRFGDSRCRVLEVRQQRASYAELACTEPARWAEVELVSPMYFSRNGRDLPLPEPVLMVRSALARWNAHAPPGLAVDEELSRTLVSAVYLREACGGTRRAPVSATMTQTGFVGTAVLGLTRAADERVARVVAALMTFAGIAGFGAQTTHGFGATVLRALGPRRPTRPAP